MIEAGKKDAIHGIHLHNRMRPSKTHPHPHTCNALVLLLLLLLLLPLLVPPPLVLSLLFLFHRCHIRHLSRKGKRRVRRVEPKMDHFFYATSSAMQSTPHRLVTWKGLRRKGLPHPLSLSLSLSLSLAIHCTGLQCTWCVHPCPSSSSPLKFDLFCSRFIISPVITPILLRFSLLFAAQTQF